MTRRTSAVVAVAEAVAAADVVLDDLDLSGDPAEALAVLIGMTWRTLEQLPGAAVDHRRTMTRDELHRVLERTRARIADVVRRGQAGGQFRADLPDDWIVSTTIALMHAAAADVEAGRLSSDQVGWVVGSTVVQALRPGGTDIAGSSA